MRFDVSYRTVFSYDEPASESQNELRAAPLSDAHQRLIDYRVSVEPEARVLSYTDAWGTRVDAFGVRRPHTSLEVLAEASVETTPRPLTAVAPRMGELRDPGFMDEHVAYLSSDTHTTPGAAVVDAARRQGELAGDDVVSTVLAVHRFVGHTLAYTPGSTDIGITVDEVLAQGVGVCQDYSHLAVAMCRSVGIPARYVSGYLFTEDDSSGTDTAADTVVVQTHAWFEAAIPGGEWLALDPTNGQMVGERHVKIGHGRSYEDVQPLRGAFLGPGASAVHATVEIHRTQAHAAPRQFVEAFAAADPNDEQRLIRARLQATQHHQQQQQ
ncbi:MAG: transglutaminase domain-containing protein [Microthrixaceae bacterium]